VIGWSLVAWFRLDESDVVGEDEHLYSVAQPQVGQDVPDVGLGGGIGQMQPAGDLVVRSALGHFDQNLAFSFGERGHEVAGRSVPGPGHRRVWEVWTTERVQQPARHAGGHHRITGGNRADRGDQLGGFNELQQEDAGRKSTRDLVSAATIWGVASMPSIPGIRMSSSTTAGLRWADSSTAAAPSPASPQKGNSRRAGVP
jgi:hypothetical protein